MNKNNAKRAFMERLGAYNQFVETFYDYLNEELTDELEDAIGTIGVGLCCEGNDLLNEDNITVKYNRYTKQVIAYEHTLDNEVKYAWPVWLTFNYAEIDLPDEEVDC